MARVRRRMWRIAKLAILCTFAGAIITIAVAWSTLWTVGSDVPDPIVCDRRVWSQARDAGVERVGTVVLTEWNQPSLRTLLIFFTDSQFETPAIERVEDVVAELPSECQSYYREFLADAELTGFRSVDLRGWPLRAMWCSPPESAGGRMTKEHPRFGITIDSMQPTAGWYQRKPTLPLRPLWGGFAIDTLFYGGALFVLFLMLGFTKRAIRTVRGRCPMCGYQLKDRAAGCSECGWGRQNEPSEPGRSRPD